MGPTITDNGVYHLKNYGTANSLGNSGQISLVMEGGRSFTFGWHIRNLGDFLGDADIRVHIVAPPEPANLTSFALLAEGWGSTYDIDDLLALADAWLTNPWPPNAL